jgi:hypothetical protein
MWKTEATHVLSVGPVQRGCLVHEALHSRLNTHLSITPDWKRLWVLPKQENFHVAVLHNTLSGKELEEASQFIRRQWPQARILVIRFGQEFLDDALYDERVTPAASTETLQAAIDRLVEDRR